MVSAYSNKFAVLNITDSWKSFSVVYCNSSITFYIKKGNDDVTKLFSVSNGCYLPDLVFTVTDVTVLHLEVDILCTQNNNLLKHRIREILKFILQKPEFLWGKLMLKTTSQLWVSILSLLQWNHIVVTCVTNAFMHFIQWHECFTL